MRYFLLMLLSIGTAGTQTKRPRIAIAGILHESNTFATGKTSLADFEHGSLKRGQNLLGEWAESKHEVGGYIEGSRRFDFELVPLMVAQATPSGPVMDGALDALTGELIERLKAAPRLDGLLLALHGAMVTESYPHGDAEIMRRVRAAVGRDFPVVVTHDFHANIAPEMVERSTVLLTYKTCPHVDQRERGVKAAEIVSNIARGRVKPVQAFARPPMLYNIRFQNTNAEPLRPIVEESRRLETQPRILAASVSGGYQYADVPYVGASVVVVADNDRALAEREAQRLSGMLWATRARLVLNLPEAAAAVAQAMHGNTFPAVLVEMGDNIGGGSAGDSTILLAELVRQNAEGWVVVIADPDAVQAAVHSGVGQAFEALVGGKTDRMHGEPVRIRGKVQSLHDGKYVETEIRHGGQRYMDQGLTAVIAVEGGTRDLPKVLMLTAKRQVPFSLQQLISCGVYPERQKILVVKAAIAFRAAYEPIAARIIEVDTPGATAVNPARFTWVRVRRPLFGLDSALSQ